MSSATSPDGAPQEGDWHPTFLHARREAVWIVLVWACCLLWAVPYCFYNGYFVAETDFDPATMSTILGLPSWTFWGIAVPWLLADLFTIWFCFFYMEDDDLGEAHEGLDIEEEVAEMHAAERKEEA